MPAVLLSIGCANLKRPTPYVPPNIYMILYDEKLMRYPWGDLKAPEQTVKATSIIGGMCLPIEEWEAREKYILELEAFGQ